MFAFCQLRQPRPRKSKGVDEVAHTSDAFYIAIFTCEDNICRACCSICCMSLSFVPIRVSRDIQLFQAVKDVRALNSLVDLLESIEFMKCLYIYTKIPPTTAITRIVVKTLVELLSILALATNLINRRRPGAFFFADILPDSM